MSQTVERALSILSLLAVQPRRVTDIAMELGVHHSTALRLLQTLRSRRFVVREEDGTYRLGSALLALAQRTSEMLDVRRVAMPFMNELNRITSETVHLAVLEGSDVVYVEKLERLYPVRMYSRVGLVVPAYCTGVGKAILAHLPPQELRELLNRTELVAHTENTITDLDALLDDLKRARMLGYARDDEEHEVGVHCIGAGIRSSDGRVRASISVAAPTANLNKEQLLSFVSQLRDATDSISRELGWAPAPSPPAAHP